MDEARPTDEAGPPLSFCGGRPGKEVLRGGREGVVPWRASGGVEGAAARPRRCLAAVLVRAERFSGGVVGGPAGQAVQPPAPCRESLVERRGSRLGGVAAAAACDERWTPREPAQNWTSAADERPRRTLGDSPSIDGESPKPEKALMLPPGVCRAVRGSINGRMSSKDTLRKPRAASSD